MLSKKLLFFSFFFLLVISTFTFVSSSSTDTFDKTKFKDFKEKVDNDFDFFVKNNVKPSNNKPTIIKSLTGKKSFKSKYGEISAFSSLVDENNSIILPNYISVKSFNKTKDDPYLITFYTGNDNVEYQVFKYNDYDITFDKVKSEGYLVKNVKSSQGTVSFYTDSFSTIILDVPDLCVPTNTLVEYNLLTQNYQIDSQYDTFVLHYHYVDSSEDDWYMNYGVGVYPLGTFEDELNLTYTLHYGVNDTLTFQTSSREVTFDLDIYNGTYNAVNSPTYCDNCQFFQDFEVNISDDCPAWPWTAGNGTNYTTGSDGSSNESGGSNFTLFEGLEHWYNLTQSTGNFLDYTGNDSITIYDVTRSQSSLNSSIDDAVDLDGVNDYIDLDNFGDSYNEFTFGGFFKPASDNTEYNIYDQQTGRLVVKIGYSSSADKLGIYCSDWSDRGAVLDITANTWTHLAFASDGSTLKTYQDGVSIDNHTCSNDLDFHSGVSFGSNYPHSGGFFDGSIDELFVYNRELNVTEINILASANTPYTSGGGGGGGSSPTQINPLPDVLLNDSVNWSWFNVSDYYNNVSEIEVSFLDPLVDRYNYLYHYSTPRSFLLQGYFDVIVGNSDPAINLYSYARPLTQNFTVLICSDTGKNYCTTDNFTLTINLSNPGIEDLLSVPLYWNLSTINKTLSPQDYFDYYDNISIVYEYNSTLNYTFSCNTNSSPFTNTDSDINVYSSCGIFDFFYFSIDSNNTFLNKTFWLNASNTINYSSDYGIFVSSNLSDEGYFDDSNITLPVNISSLYDAMPKSENDSINAYFVIITLLIVGISSFILFIIALRLGKLGIFLFGLTTWLYALFLSIGNYLPWSYTIVPPVLLIIYYSIKLIGGGGR